MGQRIGITLLLLIGIGIGGFVWWQNGLGAVNAKDTSQKIFVIERGAAIREIGNSLKEEGLIRDPVIFFLYLKFIQADKAIQAGDYRLSASMDLKTLVDTLQHGTLDFWVTFPEGLRAAEYGRILKEKISTYEPSWDEALAVHEGFLFPDTYLIPKDAAIETIITLMRNNFQKKVASINVDPEAQTIRNIVILASLIEREAKTDEEKPIIAGILTNRLTDGMALQVDATVQYAKGYDAARKSWWRPVTTDDYKNVDSSYNTYLVTGLPPGPISNPGLESIRAAASPSTTPYYYYIHDGNGTIHYARTIQEHNRNVDKHLR